MSFQSEFSDSTGWSVADTNIKTNGPKGSLFRAFLRESGVHTVIRYYASSQRAKTISRSEAEVLSADGFNILPVYQDNARNLSDFGGTNGEAAAANALTFAELIGQPDGTTILFAVDTDFSQAQIDRAVVPYFEAIKTRLGQRFRIGAYGSGALHKTLLAAGLISVPWISMSRLFTGTQDFYFNGDWAMRQVPPDRQHPASGFGYDRNVLRWDVNRIGAFRLDQNGAGQPIAEPQVVQGGANAAATTASTGPISVGAGSATLFVSTEGLNLRDRPGGTSLRELTIGTKVTDLGPADVSGWRRITVGDRSGVAFDRYLRRPKAPEIEALVAKAIGEWIRFNKGKGDEKVQPFRGFVGEMWQAIGQNFDGASVDENGDEVPWSAAFISFVVRNSGPAYRNFRFADAHSVFSHDAIQARFLNDTSKPFWGFRITEARPDLGDIIHRNRSTGTFSFAHAETHSRFTSHSDIVVEVRDDVVRVMGGNVGDTVATETGDDTRLIQEYDLNENGLIQPRAGQRLIAVLKNRAADVPI